MKCNTIKVLVESIGRKISDIPCSNIFTNMSPRARDIKERKKKWDHSKLKNFCTAKENIGKIKREPTTWEHIFFHDTSGKDLIYKIARSKQHCSLLDPSPHTAPQCSLMGCPALVNT